MQYHQVSIFLGLIFKLVEYEATPTMHMRSHLNIDEKTGPAIVLATIVANLGKFFFQGQLNHTHFIKPHPIIINNTQLYGFKVHSRS